MDKTSYRVLTLTIVCIVLLSVTAEHAFAWPCTTCPACETCTPTGCECYADGITKCGCGGKGCPGCCKCQDCVCVEDDSKCTGCESCYWDYYSGDCYCADNSSKCDPGQLCCDGQCYDTSTQKCCSDGENKWICDIDKVCCNGSCCPEGQTCCDGLTCYDPSVKKCCGEGTGHLCNIDETCCNGSCCEEWQCCINGQCVDPICDNCHSTSDTIYECGHSPDDPIGTPCATNWCIKNVLNSATCNYKGADWPCLNTNCDTAIDLGALGEVFQRAFYADCPGGYVTRDPEWILWSGCIGCGMHGYDSSYKVGSCSETNPQGPGQWRGYKYKCGCS